MKSITCIFLALACCVTAAFGQTAAPASPVKIDIAVPDGVLVVGEYNQLGDPRWTGGLGGIYPVVGSIGVYGSTMVDFLPKLATDPATGKPFYALQASARQGFHKSLIATGRVTFLVGADVGPTFSQSTSSVISGQSSIAVSFSTSVTTTTVVQLTPAISFVVPIRLLYIAPVGWNPIGEAGFLFNLKQLPKSTAALSRQQPPRPPRSKCAQ